MAVVKKISLSDERLTLVEFAQLLRLGLDTADKQRVAFGKDEVVVGTIAKIREKLPLLEAAIKGQKQATLTKEVKKAEKLRKQDISALFQAVKPFKPTRLADKRRAYESLTELLGQYRELNRVTNENSSTLVKSLLAKLATEPYQGQITLLNMNEFVTNLTESQNAYYQLFLTRKQINSQKLPSQAKALRDDLHIQYNLLYNQLANIVSYNEVSIYIPLFRILTEVRKDFVELLKLRKTLKTRQKDKEEHGEVEPTLLLD